MAINQNKRVNNPCQRNIEELKQVKIPTKYKGNKLFSINRQTSLKLVNRNQCVNTRTEINRHDCTTALVGP